MPAAWVRLAVRSDDKAVVKVELGESERMMQQAKRSQVACRESLSGRESNTFLQNIIINSK